MEIEYIPDYIAGSEYPTDETCTNCDRESTQKELCKDCREKLEEVIKIPFKRLHSIKEGNMLDEISKLIYGVVAVLLSIAIWIMSMIFDKQMDILLILVQATQ